MSHIELPLPDRTVDLWVGEDILFPPGHRYRVFVVDEQDRVTLVSCPPSTDYREYNRLILTLEK